VDANNTQTDGRRTGLGKRIIASALGWGAVAGALLSIYGCSGILDPEAPRPPGTHKGEISDIDHENTDGGVTIGWKATVEGYEGKTLEVRWTLYDALTFAPVNDTRFQDELGTTLRPEADVDRVAGSFDIPAPDDEGRYYVRIILEPPNAAALDVEETDRFSWKSRGTPSPSPTESAGASASASPKVSPTAPASSASASSASASSASASSAPASAYP
jgi:hypothetical protein